jgi:uncharacterized protein YjbI with pentapeptide repeats
MEENYIADENFKGVDFAELGLVGEEYENCTFTNCSFANTDISNIIFTECLFDNCNLAMSKTLNTGFRDVIFKNCKLLGVRFDVCSNFLLGMSFEQCQLNMASFYKKVLKKTTFSECNLEDADFIGTDLTSAVLSNCNLQGAKFEDSILDKADFRTAINYSIDLSKNRYKKAKFSMPEVIGLLNAYDIIIEN